MSKFVIAGTREQYKSFLSKQGSVLPWEYIYVVDTTTLKGISNPKGLFIGTWYDRHDIEHIIQQLLMANTEERSEGLLKAKSIIDKRKNEKAFTSSEMWKSVSILADEIDTTIVSQISKELSYMINGGVWKDET